MLQAQIDTRYRHQAQRLVYNLEVGGVCYPPYEQLYDIGQEGGLNWTERVKRMREEERTLRSRPER